MSRQSVESFLEKAATLEPIRHDWGEGWNIAGYIGVLRKKHPNVDIDPLKQYLNEFLGFDFYKLEGGIPIDEYIRNVQSDWSNKIQTYPFYDPPRMTPVDKHEWVKDRHDMTASDEGVGFDELIEIRQDLKDINEYRDYVNRPGLMNRGRAIGKVLATFGRSMVPKARSHTPTVYVKSHKRPSLPGAFPKTQTGGKQRGKKVRTTSKKRSKTTSTVSRSKRTRTKKPTSKKKIKQAMTGKLVSG